MFNYRNSQIVGCALAFFIVGCSNGKDINNRFDLLYKKLNGEITTLRKEVKQLEYKLIDTNAKVGGLKSQRVVRVPTGAPTRINAREKNRAFSAQDQLLRNGIESYQSGDVASAVGDLSLFVNRYPQSNQVDKAVYYLGQSYYNQREYEQAKQLLSTYLQKTSKTSSFVDKSKALLAKLYAVSGGAPKLVPVRPENIQSVQQESSSINLSTLPEEDSDNNLINVEEITVDDFF